MASRDQARWLLADGKALWQARPTVHRNGNDWSELFPAVVTAVQQFDISSCLIDGEIVVCDEHGLGRDDGEIERVITAMSERPGGGLTTCLSAQRRKSKSHPQDVARRHRPPSIDPSENRHSDINEIKGF
jgi:hypothetical protein